jgi:hypothetical protein
MANLNAYDVIGIILTVLYRLSFIYRWGKGFWQIKESRIHSQVVFLDLPFFTATLLHAAHFTQNVCLLNLPVHTIKFLHSLSASQSTVSWKMSNPSCFHWFSLPLNWITNHQYHLYTCIMCYYSICTSFLSTERDSSESLRWIIVFLSTKWLYNTFLLIELFGSFGLWVILFSWLQMGNTERNQE